MIQERRTKHNAVHKALKKCNSCCCCCCYPSTVVRLHRDVDLSVGVEDNSEAEAGDDHEQCRDSFDDDITQTHRELRRPGRVRHEASVDDDVETSIDGDAQRRVVVTHVHHHRLAARHGLVGQALRRLVGDLEISVRHHFGTLYRPTVQLLKTRARTREHIPALIRNENSFEIYVCKIGTN